MTDTADDEGTVGGDAVTEARRWLAGRGVEPPEPFRLAPVPAEPDRANRRTAPQQRFAGLSAASAGGESVDPRSGEGESARRTADEETTRPDQAEVIDLARSIVLRKLSAQARTRQELSRALKAKDVPDDVGEAVLDRMEDVGLVDDAGFARSWVESRQSRRHLSRTALRRELNGKGVAKEEIDSALEGVDTNAEYVAALALAQKKFRAMGGLPREVQYRRLAGALARRGFAGGVTSRVLAEVLGTQDRH